MEVLKFPRAIDVLPSIKPSFLSVLLMFACVALWANNEATKYRVSVLEGKFQVISNQVEIFGVRGSQVGVKLTGHNKTHTNVLRKNMRTADKPPKAKVLPSAGNVEENRIKRSVLDNTTKLLAIDEIRQEVINQMKEMLPSKCCKSNEQICPVGPPGSPGPRGRRGIRGRRGPIGQRGKRGLKGDQGLPGMPGSSGKRGSAGMKGDKGEIGQAGPTGTKGSLGERGIQGIVGFPGPRGEKGEKGQPGPKGIQGPRGEPGKEIFAPQVVLTPSEQIAREGENTTFNCTVHGFPQPTIEWKFQGVRIHSGPRHFTKKEGELELTWLNFTDTGQYSCKARNLLGSAEATGNLSVLAAPIFTKRPPSLVIPIEGTIFRESCQVEGFPTPVLNWSRLLQPLPFGKTETEGGNLTVRNISTMDSGLYECVATNSMGTRTSRMKVVVQKGETCDCWRTSYQTPQFRWGNYLTTLVDAIDFHANEKVILLGYRLWKGKRRSSPYNVTIQLDHDNSTIAKHSESVLPRFGDTFIVHFSQEVYLEKNLTYTASVKVQEWNSYPARNDGISNNVCAGAKVSFTKSSRTNQRNFEVRQIPALVFLSLAC